MLALAWMACARAQGTVIAPYFEGEVSGAARIALVEVVKVEPFGILDGGRKIDCGRVVDVRVLETAKGGAEPFRFSMLLGSKRLEPGARGVVFAYPVTVQEPTGDDRTILARIGALHRLLCRRAGGPLEASPEEQTFWSLDREAESKLGGAWIEVSEESFLWTANEASNRVLEEATPTKTRKRHVFSVEGVLQRVRRELEPG